MPNKPTTPATTAQRKKLFAAINRLLKEHNFTNQKVVEIKIQPKSMTALSGEGDGLVCEDWQTPVKEISNGREVWKCFPETKPSGDI